MSVAQRHVAHARGASSGDQWMWLSHDLPQMARRACGVRRRCPLPPALRLPSSHCTRPRQRGFPAAAHGGRAAGDPVAFADRWKPATARHGSGSLPTPRGNRGGLISHACTLSSPASCCMSLLVVVAWVRRRPAAAFGRGAPGSWRQRSSSRAEAAAGEDPGEAQPDPAAAGSGGWLVARRRRGGGRR